VQNQIPLLKLAQKEEEANIVTNFTPQ